MRKFLVALFLFSIAALLLGQMQSNGSTFMEAMSSAMKQMDEGISEAPMNGNPDDDFTTMMIPHHEGAIEMAKVELRFGKDPAVRRLAQEILADQQSEIDLMQLWLKKNPPHGARTGNE